MQRDVRVIVRDGVARRHGDAFKGWAVVATLTGLAAAVAYVIVIAALAAVGVR
jgi:hypothetical protein